MNVEQEYDEGPTVYSDEELDGMTFPERYPGPMSRACVYALGRYMKISQGARADT